MTAAFKQSKPSSHQADTVLKNKTATSKRPAAVNEATPPINSSNHTQLHKSKDDLHHNNGHSVVMSSANIAAEQSESNRRCSSVPRTLREKQELRKKAAKDSVVNDILNDNEEEEERGAEEDVVAIVPGEAQEDGSKLRENPLPPTQTTSLGEKIQNFFASSSSAASSSSNEAKASLKAKQTINLKLKQTCSTLGSALPLKGKRELQHI